MSISEKFETELAKDYNLPINLGLNDGTICPKSCIDIMNAQMIVLVWIHSADNDPLLDTIIKVASIQKTSMSPMVPAPS